MNDFGAARAKLITQLSREIRDKRVLDVMARIPRELFVPENVREYCYEDRPLPIGYDQTISQPFIIAFMTEALELTGREKVLEIGTGSGYQTAILAELALKVITIERISALLDKARELLKNLGYTNIEVYEAEETLGREADAPYDAIMVTAGAPEVPDALLSQLATGGRMVIPVGSRFEQELFKVTKDKEGYHHKVLGGCRFVSLIGKGAWQN